MFTLGLYQHFGYKAPFIFVIVLAGIDFVLRLLMVEKSDCLPEWLENEEKEMPTNDEKEMPAKDDTIINEEVTIGQEDEASTISTSNAEPPAKGRVSTWTLISQPRLIAAALLAFANGIIYNVFEVIPNNQKKKLCTNVILAYFNSKTFKRIWLKR